MERKVFDSKLRDLVVFLSARHPGEGCMAYIDMVRPDISSKIVETDKKIGECLRAADMNGAVVQARALQNAYLEAFSIAANGMKRSAV